MPALRVVTWVTIASVGTMQFAIFPDWVTHCGSFCGLPERFNAHDRYCVPECVNGNEQISPMSVET